MKEIVTTIIVLLIFSISCTKQESPEITNSDRLNQNEIDRLEACSKVNFNKGVLLHLNSIYLFKCMRWNEEFPYVYRALKSIQGVHWDQLWEPVDKVFISDIQRRDRFFENIRELDRKNGLDDLSRVIVALNETNFFDSLKEMFACAESRDEKICQEREHIPSKKSLKEILTAVETSPDAIEKLIYILRTIIESATPHKERLRAEINKFRQDPLFVATRVMLPTAISEKIQNGLTVEDRIFLAKVLSISSTTDQEDEKEETWIYKWIHDVKMNRDKFRDLVEYPILTNPAFEREVSGLKNAYDHGFACSVKSKTIPNELIEFDFNNHLYVYSKVVKDRSYRDFFDFSISELTMLKMSTEVCSEFENNKYGINFLSLLNKIASFLGERKFYDLMKFLVSNTTIKADAGKSFAENLYLFDFFANEIFKSANSINKSIIEKNREFYPVMFDVLLEFPEEFWPILGSFLGDTLLKKNDTFLKGVAGFWRFFNTKEKNFLFNFLDRHFEGETQYLLLFDFYTKFLNDFRETNQVFYNQWASTEEQKELTYYSLKDVFLNLSGKETLDDFKRFFGRDQILRVLEVLSGGEKIKKVANEQLDYMKSNAYVLKSKSDKYKFNIVYNPAVGDNYDASEAIECMKAFSEIDKGFYQLIRKLPKLCSQISNEFIGLKLYTWLNSIDEFYLKFKPATGADDSILSERGLVGPYLLNTSIGLTKIIDSILGELNSMLPTQNGVKYLLNSTRYHVVDMGLKNLLSMKLSYLNDWFNVLPEKNLIFRNSVLKTFSNSENFSYSNIAIDNMSKLSTAYGEWIGLEEFSKKKSLKKLVEHDPKFDCKNVINQFVAPHGCPSAEIVKKYGTSMMKYLTTSWNDDEETPASILVKALKAGEGIEIPLRGNDRRKYRLTLRELFKLLYDASDKTLPVNRLQVLYVNERGEKRKEELTTLERVESVIREVRFDNNYLGVAYLNAMVHAKDYNDEVLDRRRLLNMCVNLPGIRCSRSMSDSDLRMAKNSLEMFDGLVDINNGRNLESKLSYGKYLSTFEQALVASSAKKAQAVQLFPLSDELLIMHNGRLLSDLSMMSMPSNMARTIRDRVGRNEKDFARFINSEGFRRVDNAFLYAFDLKEAASSINLLINNILNIPNGEKENLFENSVDWIASLNYQNTRLLEDTIARLLLVGSYLGPPEIVFGTSNGGNVTEKSDLSIKYRDNNLFQLFLSLEKLVINWPMLKKLYPADKTLIQAFVPLNNFLIFFSEQLLSTQDPKKNIAYRVLNDIYLVLDSVLFEDHEDVRLIGKSENKIKGLDLFIEGLKSPGMVLKVYDLIPIIYDYLSKVHDKDGAWFKVVGQNIGRITSSSRIDLTPFRDYLRFTTKNKICFDIRMDCTDNYHFDEVGNIVRFLNEKPNNRETNFNIAIKKVFMDEFDSIVDLIDDLLPSVKIKEVKIPMLD